MTTSSLLKELKLLCRDLHGLAHRLHADYVVGAEPRPRPAHRQPHRAGRRGRRQRQYRAGRRIGKRADSCYADVV